MKQPKQLGPKCSECGKEKEIPERLAEWEDWVEANRRIDYFEFSDPPAYPFCECGNRSSLMSVLTNHGR